MVEWEQPVGNQQFSVCGEYKIGKYRKHYILWKRYGENPCPDVYCRLVAMGGYHEVKNHADSKD